MTAAHAPATPTAPLVRPCGTARIHDRHGDCPGLAGTDRILHGLWRLRQQLDAADITEVLLRRTPGLTPTRRTAWWAEYGDLTDTATRLRTAWDATSAREVLEEHGYRGWVPDPVTEAHAVAVADHLDQAITALLKEIGA